MNALLSRNESALQRGGGYAGSSWEVAALISQLIRKTIMCGAVLSLTSASLPGNARGAYVLLNDHDYIVRLAMDLKGTRPTPGELATPPGEVGALIEQYMQTPEFDRQMMWLANDIFLTRTDFIEYFMSSYNYNDQNARYDVVKSVGEEPLRLFSYIVRNDRPLTELVTADYTVADSTLAWFWDIEYPGGYYGGQWLPGRYKDGREHAGVLTQSSFYYRYSSTPSNKHRHRANNITRIFLDDDHFLRDVALELRLGANRDLDLDNAVLTNTGCIACHSSLDGIASHLNTVSLGPDRHSLYARKTFSHFSEQGMQRSTLVHQREPSYYGYPSRGMKDLGNYIASDPRFAVAMTKHFCKHLFHRNLDYRDRDLLIRFARVLRESNYNTKALIRSIVASDEYRAVGVSGGSAKPTAYEQKAALALNQQRTALLGLSPLAAELHNVIAEEVQDATERIRRDEFLIAHVTGADDAVAVSLGKTANSGSHAAEITQPFKLAMPEQLHSLGLFLTGEIWSGGEGSVTMSGPFPILEYKTGIKVAAGGYDGNLILERRWAMSPTYLLVLARWAEVIAEDVYDRELRKSVPYGERRVFKLITGKEDPREAEPMVRAQIAQWFELFYSERVDPWGPEVSDVFGVLLLAKQEFRNQNGWDDIKQVWRDMLALMLSDPRVAIY